MFRILVFVLGLAAAPAAAEVVVRPDLAPTGQDRVAWAVTVPLGDTLRIELPSQPGTGYSWEMRAVDPARLEPVEAACPERDPSARVGARETACFALRALAPGETEIVLVYRRHWETRPDGVLRCDLAVTVEPGRPGGEVRPQPR